MNFNETDVRRWWDCERAGRLVEIRTLSDGRTGSGYFSDIEALLQSLRQAPDGVGVYYTVNTLNPALSGRRQHEFIVSDRGIKTTADSDILGRDVLLVDIDPARPAHTNATDAEVRDAELVANRVYSYLRDSGWAEPQILHSGNGVHLKYRIRLSNTDANRDLVRSCLEVLDLMFSTDRASVDCSVYNAARICKLPGTRSAKGYSTADRPQRMCTFVRVPDQWDVTEREYLERLASAKPAQETPSRSNNYNSSPFDIDTFIREHNIAVDREVVTPTHRKIILDHCPWCEAHRAPDAALFVMPNGAVGFKCLHAHCAHYTFRDFRLFYDPEAYDRRTYTEYRQKLDYYSPSRYRFKPKEENPADGPKWLRLSDIKYVSQADTPSIPCGYPDIDAKMGNLLLGDVTILSGRNASGKSIILNSVILNMAARDVRVAVWSGEFQPSRYVAWLCQTAAGKAFVRRKEGYENLWYCPRSTAERITRWLDDRVWLYSSENYSSNWAQLCVDIRGVIALHGIQCIILDNLSAMDLSEVDAGSQFEKQKSLIVAVKDIAKSLNVHIILVVHPRKTTTLLRKEDVSGDFAITNLSDNLLLIHRTNRDFELRAKEFFRKEVVDDAMRYDTVVEIAKCRNTGAEDCLIGLYYEPETKRLKSDIADNTVYPWADDAVTSPEPPATPSGASAPVEQAAPDLPPDPDPYLDILDTTDECPF